MCVVCVCVRHVAAALISGSVHTVWSLRMNDASCLWGEEESSRCVCVHQICICSVNDMHVLAAVCIIGFACS